MFEIKQGEPRKTSVNSLLFLLFLLIMLIDRAITLYYFGFVYTDMDQLVIWNGAADYSNGIFHEPYFYGQPYNYMIEALVAVPFMYLNLPVYMALPLATSLISLLPFFVLGILFFRKKKFFWSYLCLLMPVMLSLDYNFLTTIPRGFIQAYVFIPFLFIPLLHPENKKNVTVLFVFSALCFIANQSSILIIFPLIIYVASYHWKTFSFYLKGLWMVPVLLLDQASKHYYKIHPEKVLHYITGLKLDFQTFISAFGKVDLFEYVVPFTSTGGFVYALLFIMLVLIAFRKGLKKELLFIISAIFIVLVSFAIPKVQDPYPIENAGIFFTFSRFYLLLPILLIISAYLVFKDVDFRKSTIYVLVGFSLIAVIFKNVSIEKHVQQTVEKTVFPIVKNQELIDRNMQLKALVAKYEVDLMVHKLLPSWSWSNLYDSFAYYPLTNRDKDLKKKANSVNLSGDRRTWLYDDAPPSKRILLLGFEIEEALLDDLDYEMIDNDYILIKNNSLPTRVLFEKLDLKFGNH